MSGSPALPLGTATACVHLARASVRDVPAGDDWLTAAERAVTATLRLPKRLDDWRLGRWAAKRAVIACAADAGSHPRPSEVEVLAQAGGAPGASITAATGARAVRVSISHRDGVGFAAASLGDVALGCDVERIEPRTDAFVADYFTPAEQALVARAAPVDRDAVVMLVWSAKESALKALGAGLRLDTHAVHVDGMLDGSWIPGRSAALIVHGPDRRVFTGCVWMEEEWVMTMVANQCVVCYPPRERLPLG